MRLLPIALLALAAVGLTLVTTSTSDITAVFE
jgi:hypothetical protein